MNRRILASVLAVICVFSSTLTGFAETAAQPAETAQAAESAEKTVPAETAEADRERESTQETESAQETEAPAETKPAAPVVYPLCLRRESSTPDAICKEITDTYQKATTRSGFYSFTGLCGAFVSWQTLLLGIDWEYQGGNGNDLFDKYKDLPNSTGGYGITAYAAPDYTLRSAIAELTAKGPVFDLLIGYEHGSNTATGKKYGHALFVNAIIDDQVYFSESFRFFVNRKYYKEGSPIVCSVEDFCKVYDRSFTQFEGIIHFTAPDETFTTGTWGNLSWALEDGTLKINGQGAMPTAKDRAPWHLMYRYIRGIEIGEGVTTVTANAFAGYDAVKEISLPDTMEALEASCFEGCNAITELSIGSHVSTIARGVFSDCANLKTVEIARENPWFLMRDGLLLNKDGTMVLGSLMGNADTFTLPEGITAIGSNAFRGCSYRAIQIPDTVTQIDSRAFVGCKGLQELRLLGTNPVYTYRQGALIENGTLLRSMLSSRAWVGVPGGVAEISDYAFSTCPKAQEIALPAEVTAIGQRAFADCPELLRLSFPKNAKGFSFKDGILYSADKTEAVQAICVAGEKAVIANGTEVIRENAFLFADSVTAVEVPDSVTNIGRQALGFGEDGKRKDFTIISGTEADVRQYAADNRISWEQAEKK